MTEPAPAYDVPTPPPAPAATGDFDESAGTRSIDLGAYGRPSLIEGTLPQALTSDGNVIAFNGHSWARTRSELMGAPAIRLKDHGQASVSLDRSGDIHPARGGEQAFYDNNTRFATYFGLLVNGQMGMFLGANVSDDNLVAEARLSFKEKTWSGQPLLISRETVLHGRVLYQNNTFENPSASERTVTVSISAASDFFDLFQVRGIKRQAEGKVFPPAAFPEGLKLSYVGLDDRSYETKVATVPAPTSTEGGTLFFDVVIPPRQSVTLQVSVVPSIDDDKRAAAVLGSFGEARAAAKMAHKRFAPEGEIVSSNSRLFNEVMKRAWHDLGMLTSETPFGLYPHAGVPWYNTVFGRDGVLSALMVLPFHPELTRGVLNFLANTVATEEDSFNGAQPGRVIHEIRGGEMAHRQEVPFGKSYQSADATPLTVMTAAEYLRHTGDKQFIAEIWPKLELMMGWIDTYGGVDGLVKYQATNPRGLKNLGWMDSDDSMFNKDGTDAKQPIVVCEIPGYVFAAKNGMAYMAQALGFTERAETLRSEAQRIKSKFNELFWSESLQSYGRAVDGDGKLLEVLGSNAGHTLMSGIATPERAEILASTLFGKNMYSGWGIRTLATDEARYYPYGYHLGTVWWHDNSIVGHGLGMFGYTQSARELFKSALDAANADPLRRMPELISGEARGDSNRPMEYPTACSPQAWAATSPIFLLRGMLGLQIDGMKKEIRLVKPCLPHDVGNIQMTKMHVGDTTTTLTVRRTLEGVVAESRNPEVKVIVSDEANVSYLEFPYEGRGTRPGLVGDR